MNILVVDDEANIRKMVAISLESDSHRVVAVASATDARLEAAQQPIDLAFIDLRLGAEVGTDLIPVLRAFSPSIKLVMMTGHASVESAVEALRRGAVDYITKPFSPADIRKVTEQVESLRSLEKSDSERLYATDQHEVNSLYETSGPAMQRILDFARQVAASEANLLLHGESGTGKGVLAHAIHLWSARSSRSFATISCPTLSAQLLESELFGHVKGAFTNAIRDNPGRIAQCEGGTLFLDEIGDLPLSLQPKLLRFLQDREYEPVGDMTTRRADVRIITATNVNLENAVRNGLFREDLYYRINVLQIDIPPLRHRPEEILQLANRFRIQFQGERAIVGFTEAANTALQRYQWPGNIRELRNAIERAVLLCRGPLIGGEQLPSHLTPRTSLAGIGDSVTLDRIEEAHIRRILERTNSMVEAAEVLGINVATLWRKRKRFGI